MPNEEYPQAFVRRKVPWIVAGGALLLFLLTVNHWVNLRSLPVVSRIAGWDLGLPVQWPLLHLVTYFVRFLPAAWEPLALNIFTAFCAAVTLGLLARSVALLPHDRTHEQRIRERSEFSLLSIKLAWVPVLLAVLVCGLQLTFWEHATAITGEIFDLLVFAYVVRCLLEYRVSQEERWLSKMALVYGLGVTNNWAMIGFFPAFLIAIVWIKGIRFFEPEFLLRMTLFGIAGLSLYLLLPAIWMFKSNEDFTFLQVLQANWTSQKLVLVNAPSLRNRALLLSLTSLLPVFLMGIRWPSRVGDTSAAGESLSNVAFRVIHLFFLGACLWVAFDPGFSPRYLGLGLPFLTFYYLAALAIGYYSGYALLVFRGAPRKSWKRDEAFAKFFNPIVQFVVLAVLIAVPAGLFYKNFPAVRSGNGPMLREFADRTTRLLPREPAYLLSEDPYQLALVRASLESRNDQNEFVLVNTRSLETPAYHQQLRKHYGPRWPEVVDPSDPPAQVAQVDIQQTIRNLAASNSVIYLHPSFGYFFELLYPEPSGQIYRLKTFAPDQVLPPALSPEEIQSNQAFWNQADYLGNIQALKGKDSPDATYLAQYYSRALNAWGVFTQRAGDLADAGKHFARALQLNTNNVPAQFNAQFNRFAQAGDFSNHFDMAQADEILSIYRSWDELLAQNGPIDQPEMCFMLGARFIGQAQYRQAALQFARTTHFQPTNFPARLNFAKALIFGGWAPRGLAEIDKLETDIAMRSPNQNAEIAATRSSAYFVQDDLAKAEEILTQARQTQPENPILAESLMELYRNTGRITNAIAILDQQIQRQPTNIVAQMQKAELSLNRDDFESAQATLDNILSIAPGHVPALLFQAFGYIQEKKFDQALIRIEKVLQSDSDNVQALIYMGVINMELKAYDKARTAFDQALNVNPGNVTALRNRAILSLRRERWADARDDYEELRKVAPKSHAVLYGLGEVAFHQNDREAAERYYKSYQKHAPPGGSAELLEEKKKVEARLLEIGNSRK